jgi:oligopeptide/dipeptide ABC transporter ATP-binding protein
MLDDVLIETSGLRKHFPVRGGFLGRPKGTVKAVENVNLAIRRGEMLGLVGESGSGKSTLGRLMMRLVEPTEGDVRLDGQSIVKNSAREMNALRARMQMIFQDPYSSLNRYFTIERTLVEPLLIHRIGKTHEERLARAVSLLEQVGFGPEALPKYPHQFSGGQRQRIGIARALALEPDFIVADEPVSALDVSVQAQVLNILSDLRRDFALTMLFITHDLSVVRQIADRVVVLYLGHVMEIAPTERLFGASAHPYTRALIASAPSVRADKAETATIEGEIPDPRNPPSGCPFRTRCPRAIGACAEAPMVLKQVSLDQQTACIRETGSSPQANPIQLDTSGMK